MKTETCIQEESELSKFAREFIDYMRVEKGSSRNTIDAYRRSLIRYIEYLRDEGISKPDNITRKSILGFASWLGSPEGANLSSRSRAQAFSVIRMFHRFLLSEGFVQVDPTTVLSTPKIPSNLPRSLNREQVEMILDCCGGDNRGIRDRAILEFLYATGVRISELCALDLGDVDIKERLVIVRGKGGKWRLVPFGRVAAQSLKTYLVQARPDICRSTWEVALFLNMRGTRITRQGCWKIIKEKARVCGLENVVSPHIFRHTFATHLLDGGANLLVVQELLGHASIATTQIYTEVKPERLKEIYRKTHPRA